MSRFLIGSTVLVASLGVLQSAFAESDGVDFQSDIQPLLAKHCVDCHGPDLQESGLRLDRGAYLKRGGDRGPVIIPEQSDQSRLYLALTHDGDFPRMPMDADPLTENELALVKRWIDAGAKIPQGELTADAIRPESDHWAFQPIVRPRVPLVDNQDWVRNSLDHFVLNALEKRGIVSSVQAERTTLIRRLSLDLRGLPPTLEEIDQFLADDSPDAYDRLVDRFLSSPHYGERWGRHWLDVARYADSSGFTIDGARKIWLYRDWVIRALNEDLPFDQFTIEQLAGDMLEHPTTWQTIATGFHRNTLINQEGGTDQEQFRVEAVVDRVNTTGSVWLGLTVGCAQCHQHKYDPISQREYYQLFAIFNNADEPTITVATQEQQRRLKELNSRVAAAQNPLDEYDQAHPVDLSEIDSKTLSKEGQKLAAIPEEERTEAQRKQLIAAIRQADVERKTLAEALTKSTQERDRFRKTIPTTMVMRERSSPRTTRIHIRGDFLRKGAQVTTDVPAVLPPFDDDISLPNRLDFARWLVDDRNPLTARVTVNRVWQRYFGTGLVRTEDDFGTQGAEPTHPELLDWLAAEFQDEQSMNWRLKRLHRLIVTSATYRQSSAMRSELLEDDPANQMLARQSRLRLEAEIIRDVALASSGLLSAQFGGPSVYPPQPEGIYVLTQVKKPWPESQGLDRYRRGLYTYFWRSSPYPLLPTFDAPEGNTTCTRRSRSNTPLQALTLANDRMFVELARGLSGRILREGPEDDQGRLRWAFRVCLSREPDAEEMSVLMRFLALQRSRFADEANEIVAIAPMNPPTDLPASEGAAWTAIARVLMNIDEFITRE